MNKIEATIITTIVLFTITACNQEKNTLDNRVMDYWSHKINRDFDKAYEFLSPGWKGKEDKDKYARRINKSVVNWLSINIKEKQCSEAYLCTVISEIEYDYNFRGAVNEKMKVKSDIKERWIMKDNVWYHVPIKVNINEK